MTPLKIGACMRTSEIETHRDWLFDTARDIELQDFMTHTALSVPSRMITLILGVRPFSWQGRF
jgi:hypothetical protein